MNFKYDTQSAPGIISFFPGECIQCYSCDSIDNEYCDDPFNFTALEPGNCTNENFACIKREKYDKNLNRTYLYRGCIQKHFCEVLARAADYCFTCTSDYCNSSSKLLLSWNIFLIVIFYIFIAK